MILFSIKQYFLFNKRKSKKNNIFFFSEGFSSWNILSTQFNLFNNNSSFKTYYLTSDKNEYDFLIKKYENIFYIGKGSVRTIWLNSLSGKCLITTIPDLNIYQWKKSQFIEKYIYLFHSLGSTFFIYNDKAFDSYDLIMCCSEYQYDELTENKIKKNLSQKIIKSGYTLIENIKKDSSIKERNGISILLAPTWSIQDGLANTYLELILEKLKKIQNIKVIARFHPMTLLKSKSILEKINKDNFIEIDNTNTFESYYSSDILITDWSTCSIEYSIITKNPSIHINTQPKKRNKTIDIDSLKNTFEKKIRNKIGIEIEIEDLESLNYHFILSLKKSEKIKSNINELDKLIYNKEGTNQKIYEQICYEIN